jgi:L-ascorbate metabolism protein UlaG (beta-lactamase superfamily)
MAKNFLELATFAARMAPTFLDRLQRENQRLIASTPHRPALNSWPKVGLHAAWFGHTTVYLSIDGFTILTDPVFSSKIGINFGAMTIGLKRLVEPAVQISAFPQPDLVLLSHAHMDHFDIPSLRRLAHGNTTIATAANTRDLLPRACHAKAIHELAWNENIQIGPARIRAFQVQHWGARMRTDTHRGYNGYLIDVGRFRIVFGGDTARTDTFRSLRSSKAVDLAIMPIGAYNPWIHAHCNPEQALAMANEAGADFILPVHHKTFELSQEPTNEPIERLLRAAGPSPDRIVTREIGQEFHRF